MNLNELKNQAYKTACEHGFYYKELSYEHCLCLVISELMEAVEADRKNKYAKVYSFKKEMDGCLGIGWKEDSAGYRDVFQKYFSMFIKDSVSDGLADAAIRLLDLAGLHKIDMNDRFIIAYIVSKKKSFTENIYAIIKYIVTYRYSFEESLNYAIRQIFELAKFYDIDLTWHIEQKMKYNKLRERMHGKKY